MNFWRTFSHVAARAPSSVVGATNECAASSFSHASGNCAAGSKVIRCLVEAHWVARLVIRVASWNPNHQTFPCSREQHSIFVSEEFLINGLLDLLPNRTNKTPEFPFASSASEIPTPTDADPIQFESLTLKFCQSDFKHVRGSNDVVVDAQ